jgi:hypothetical protein
MEGEFVITEEHDELVRKIGLSTTLIRLQLNPRGPIDRNIISLLNVLVEHRESEDYERLESLLVSHAQWLLKEEWEKVKFESRGPTRYLWDLPKRIYRGRAYARFCGREGSVSGFAGRSKLGYYQEPPPMDKA